MSTRPASTPDDLAADYCGEPEIVANTHVAALQKLRAVYVEARRGKVAESLLHDYPSGNERRLCEVQNAIAAIDDAIHDEVELAGSAVGVRSTARAVPITGDRSANAEYPPRSDRSDGAANSAVQHAWPSYAAWRNGSNAASVDDCLTHAPCAAAIPEADHGDMLALWRSWGAPAQLTEAQVDAMLSRSFPAALGVFR